MTGYLYVSGPMSGLPDENHPVFRAEAARLRAMGHLVVDPSENFNGQRGRPKPHYMRVDIPHACGAEGIVLLPGWTTSEGALVEVLAAIDCGRPFYLAGCAPLVPVSPGRAFVLQQLIFLERRKVQHIFLERRKAKAVRA